MQELMRRFDANVDATEPVPHRASRGARKRAASLRRGRISRQKQLETSLTGWGARQQFVAAGAAMHPVDQAMDAIRYSTSAG
jgi:hypothetical protein